MAKEEYNPLDPRVIAAGKRFAREMDYGDCGTAYAGGSNFAAVIERTARAEAAGNIQLSSLHDFGQYLDVLHQELPDFAERAAAAPTGQGSPEWMAEAGAFWRELRKGADITRSELVERTGLHINTLRLAENGVKGIVFWEGEFPERIAVAIDKPEAADGFRRQFDLRQTCNDDICVAARVERRKSH